MKILWLLKLVSTVSAIIGRIVFRAAQHRDDIEVVGINDLIDVEYMAYMLKYDSTHGRFDGTVEVKDGNL